MNLTLGYKSQLRFGWVSMMLLVEYA